MLAWRSIQDNVKLAQSFIEGMTSEQFGLERKTFYAGRVALRSFREPPADFAAPARISIPSQGGDRSRTGATCSSIAIGTPPRVSFS